jgi:hypothetical protein
VSTVVPVVAGVWTAGKYIWTAGKYKYIWTAGMGTGSIDMASGAPAWPPSGSPSKSGSPWGNEPELLRELRACDFLEIWG